MLGTKLMTRTPDGSTRPITVGAVSYLNTRPLVYSLKELAPDIELVFDLPSRLADGLADSRFDVALVPSIQLLDRDDYRIISDACIACRGPVLSVKLLTRTPMPEIRTLALDEGSRTSGVLARILLKARYDLEPNLRVFPVNSDLEDCSSDAVLVIGDRAIHPPVEDFVECWDLGEQWCQWSGKPFVFAVWAANSDLALGKLTRALTLARDAGQAHLQEIASQYAGEVGLSEHDTLRYLRDNLHFQLGPAEKQGLDLFFQLAAELSAASESQTAT